jgi:hypothetical protein
VVAGVAVGVAVVAVGVAVVTVTAVLVAVAAEVAAYPPIAYTPTVLPKHNAAAIHAP